MYILSMDSTAKVASVALCETAETGLRVLGLSQLNNGNTHSETLLPMAEELLERFSLRTDEIGLFAVSAGPGSFTGVRIGVSTVKGLAFGTEIPCVGVSTLEALATNLTIVEGLIVAVMDARRGQLYNALFACHNGELTRLTPDRAIPLAELTEEVKTKYPDMPVWLTGDGYDLAATAFCTFKDRFRPTPPLLQQQNAVSVACIGFDCYLAGQTVSDAELTPTYLRLSQAERERNEKINQKNKES